MTSKTAAKTYKAGDVALVYPGELADSPLNPRKRYDKDSIAELAESMRRIGFTSTVRARVQVLGGLELVYGHRRKRAALLADCAVRVEVVEADDHQVRLQQAAENAGREDVTPLEEADHVVALSSTMTPEEIAAHMGRSVSHVRRRLSLAALEATARDHLEGGRLSVAVAELIASIPRTVDQKKAATELSILRAGDPLATVVWARAWIARELTRRLSLASFNPGDADLVAGAGSCVTCPKNTANSGGLFRSAGDEPELCTDGACWSEKSKAAWEVAKKEAKTSGAKVLKQAEADALIVHGRLTSRDYVDLSDEVRDYTGTLRGTWAGLLAGLEGYAGGVVLARPRGSDRHHWLTDRKEATRALKSLGVELRAPRKAKSDAERQAEKEVKLESAARDVADGRAQAVVVAHAAALTAPWCFAARAAIRLADPDAVVAASVDRLGSDPKIATHDVALEELVAEWARVGDIHSPAVLVVELLARTDPRDACDMAGLSYGEILDAARAELTAAATKAKAPKATTSKKAPDKKAKTKTVKKTTRKAKAAAGKKAKTKTVKKTTRKAKAAAGKKAAGK